MSEKLSKSQEDYLEVILACVNKEGHAHVKDIAARLNVRMPSVTEALRSLNNAGLVNYKRYGTVTLTDEGRRIAARVEDRHELLERFMINILGVSAEEAEDNACRMEHTISDEVLDRLARYVEFVDRCPVQACTWQSDQGAFCNDAASCGRSPSA